MIKVVVALSFLSMACLHAEGTRLAPSRILRAPTVWFSTSTPTQLPDNAKAEAETAKGTPPQACQTITRTDEKYCSFGWTGLNLPLPEDKLLHVPVYLDNFQGPGGFSIALAIQLTNSGGTISYLYSSNCFVAAGWTYLPIWDPSTPAHAVFNKTGFCSIAKNTGFDFSKPVTAISYVPNNLPVGSPISIGSIETMTKTKPIIVVTDDITDNSTYTQIVAIMEAAGFRGGLRIGGAKEHSYSEGNMQSLRKAYDNGWDAYNGSWSRCALIGSTTA